MLDTAMTRRRICSSLTIAALATALSAVLAATPIGIAAHAQSGQQPPRQYSGQSSGQPNVPRFVSIGSDKVNVRTGPGVRYPVAWQFVRRGLPVEVIAEFELWRKVRDMDGAEGWIHKSLLSGRRTVVVRDRVRTFYRRPDAARIPVFEAEPGVIGKLLSCRESWCRMEVSGLRGWAPQAYLWGVYEDETVN